MALDRMSYTPDQDGTSVMTRSVGPEGRSAPQVVARVYDRDWAFLLATSPELFDAVKWCRELFQQGTRQCQPGVKGCVLCVTDGLLTEIESSNTP